MEYRRHTNGLLTFFEHWWLVFVVLVAVLTSQVFSFLSELTGARWVWCYGFALAIAVTGVSLIFHAKVPLYRQRRFFTFGSRPLPENRRWAYRWGWRCILLATVLFVSLLLSRP